MKPLAYLKLVRFSLAPTLIADSAAGLAWSGAAFAFTWVHGASLLTSLLLFCGGMALNACVDLAADRVNRPERPVPSGEVRPAAAAVCAAFGLLAPAGFWWLLSGPGLPSYWVTGLSLLIAGYHTPLRRNPVTGPLLLGLIRGVHLGLAPALIVPPTALPAALWLPAAAYAGYVFAASLVAHQEDRTPLPGFLRAGLLLGVTTLLLVPLCPLFTSSVSYTAASIAGVILVIWRLPVMLRLWRIRPWDFDFAGKAARVLLGQMAVVTAALCFLAESWRFGVTALLAMVALRLLVRWIPPT